MNPTIKISNKEFSKERVSLSRRILLDRAIEQEIRDLELKREYYLTLIQYFESVDGQPFPEIQQESMEALNSWCIKASRITIEDLDRKLEGLKASRMGDFSAENPHGETHFLFVGGDL